MILVPYRQNNKQQTTEAELIKWIMPENRYIVEHLHRLKKLSNVTGSVLLKYRNVNAAIASLFISSIG